MAFEKFKDRMAKVPIKVQLESQMISMGFLCLGLVMSAAYFLIYYDFRLWYRIVLGLNLLAGVVLMLMSALGVYQQYRGVCESLKFQEELKKIQEVKNG
jgi:hypothetical protein